ncbi:PaaI family thioesterase [Roseobacter sp. CCS2]|uniref:PaaI family thioesterase n=1 Tax=Roseobacter sp. CCS2 TaxID=391593 RepID=UPI0000F4006A|nr:PaaI family thioesterase [Roseobacter sp. CCS2]EBA13126.1 Phenylacetic acid degradation-related protein [Roseobacter sp. CCS2]
MFTATSPDQMPDLETTLSMSGLAFMQAMRDGQISRPPISALMNYQLEKVETGEIIFRGTPEFQHTNPAGGVHGGWYGTLLDSCMSCAVMTATPKGSVYTTLEYKVNMVGAIPVGREIRAIGTITHAGRSTGVAHGEIRDAETDKLYATGSATCLIMKLRGD